MRTELLFRGVKPAPLFSYRDRTLREMLTKIKISESHQLMATLAASVGDSKLANESNAKYRDSIWYTDIKESRNERMFKEYYTTYKHLQPEMSQSSDGKLIVRGLT